MKAEPPTDREVLAAVNTKRVAGKAEAQDEFQNDITIVKNLVVNKIDPPRVFPVVGQAQLHHAHWECAVYSRDAVTQKPKVDVVFVDKDKLHAHIDGK